MSSHSKSWLPGKVRSHYTLHFYIPKLTFVTKNNFTYFSTEQEFLSLTKYMYSKSISKYNANFPVSKFSTQKYKCQ